VSGFPDLAKDFRTGEVSLLFKDFVYDFAEALDDAWTADSALPSFDGVIELFNSWLLCDRWTEPREILVRRAISVRL
jgi:hypothetical protein